MNIIVNHPSDPSGPSSTPILVADAPPSPVIHSPEVNVFPPPYNPSAPALPSAPAREPPAAASPPPTTTTTTTTTNVNKVKKVKNITINL